MRGHAFAELTRRGQGRRLRRLARTALACYDLDVRRVRLVANHLNGIFRVETVDGQVYALRVSHPTWRTDADLRLELAWLRALAREPEIGAPVPLPNTSGAPVTVAASDGVPEPRRCVLMTWIPGIDLADRLTEPGVRALGELAARLHAHTAAWQPSGDVSVRRMDRLFARDEPDALFGETASTALAGDVRVVLARARERVEAVLAALYGGAERPRVIHNDLNQGNVKVWRGRLRPLDFEDAIWGYPAQDIAMTFHDLLFYTDLEYADYVAMRAAFQQGYTQVAEWPEAAGGQIEALMVGRELWRANYVACREPEYLGVFSARVAARLRSWPETGQLAR